MDNKKLLILNKSTILSIGVRDTTNIGDVAISNIVEQLFKSQEFIVIPMNFNFKSVVYELIFKLFDSQIKFRTSIFKFVLSSRIVKVGINFIKYIIYMPIVAFIFWRKVRKSSKVFIGGGNLLMGIEYGFPIQALTYVILAKLAGKPVYFLCVGAGPFTVFGAKTIINLALRMVDGVILRDRYSYEFIRKQISRRKIKTHLLPDPVLLWSRVKPAFDNEKILIFNVMPLFSPVIFSDGSLVKAKNFAESMIKIISDLVTNGSRVELLITDSKVDYEINDFVARKVYENTGVGIRSHMPTSPNEMAAIIASAEIVFSTRMHGAIMSFSQGVPAICVNWQIKVKGLYEDIGLNDLLVEIGVNGAIDVHNSLSIIKDVKMKRDDYSKLITEKCVELKSEYHAIWMSFK